LGIRLSCSAIRTRSSNCNSQQNITPIPGRRPAGRAAPGLGVIAAAGRGLRDPGQGLSDASVDPTEASYMPTDASVVENARRPVAVHRKSDLNRRRSDSSEPIMSLIRPAHWAGDGARRRIESAGSESVMSCGILSTTVLLRATMERPDSVVAGQLPVSGDTESFPTTAPQ
jgi:hypothetical protein